MTPRDRIVEAAKEWASSLNWSTKIVVGEPVAVFETFDEIDQSRIVITIPVEKSDG